MYPVSDSEWQFTKNEPVEETPAIGNVSRSWQWRERGIDPPNYPPNKKVFENIAEDILVQKPLHIRSCDLPGSPRSTFLMVFSPDGTKVASTHGNHNVYVSELASGKHVRILKGHPRTPWCIAFHPSHPQLIGSGCLGGQVRVWDIASGGSEVWNVRNETVIASIAFHPREQLLVIATYNELYFWDWSNPTPATKVSTNNVNEKVRFVAFDSLGYKLITGISLWTCPPNTNSVPLATMNSNSSGPSSNGGNSNGNSGNGNSGNGNGGNGNGGSGNSGGGGGSGSAGGSGDGDDSPGSNRPPESPGAAQDMIVNSYQTLVQRYDSLVRNYQRLFMVRHRLTNTPPPPNTIDRGTDPMETYPLDLGRRRRAVRWRLSRTATNTTSSDNNNPTPSTSRGRADAGDSGDGESSSSRFLNLDVLSFDSDTSRNQDSPTQERSPFGSRSSAFQPLNESERTFRTVDQNERARLLPNPFSSRAGAPPLRAGVPLSRSHRLLLERTDPSADLPASRTSIFTSSREPDVAQDLTVRLPVRRRNVAAQSTPRAAPASAPATANSSTQMTPDIEDADARAINESLDLIRDILRDSGTRLLNLITDMSANLMAGRRDEIERDARRRPDMRSLTRELLHSSSEDEAERASVRRARDAAFRELPGDRAASDPPADRLLVELEDAALGGGGFRVRTHSAAPDEPPPRRPLARFDPDAPSTSRDDFWSRGSDLPSVEAFRRVRTGVCALNRHTAELARAWLRGERYNPAQLRTSWENLRRRVLALQRDAGRQDSPGYYTRSLLDRCMLLTEMSEGTARPRPARAEPRPDDAPAGPSTDTAASAESPAATGARPPRPAILRSPRASISLRPLALRRRSSNLRWQSAGEPGARRPRVQRPPRPSRREFARTFEMTATRHEIRMRAMQVLSVMFNMMMMCLGEDGLNYLIVHMLKALKKSLALSCFMMMSKRNAPPRRPAAAAPPSRDTESADVVRIQNAEHAGPVNVDGPDEPGSPRADDGTETAARVRSPAAAPPPVAPPAAARAPSRRASVSDERRSPPAAAGARWSRRLAVQIAVANRNDSNTARTRRDLYLEGRRQKALHRTDPAAHPLVKRRFPPVSGHRIPALRRLPRAPARNSPRRASQSDEPTAGPSGVPPRPSAMAIDNRDLLRIAQLQAVRLRNAARNRFRRLQTIRLYTPSSVFALQSSGGESPQEGASSAGAAPAGGAEGRRTFAGGWGAAGARAPDAGQFHAVLNNVAMPLMQVNDLPPADAPHQAQRMPRIHEYLQPIILAQNAMVVEDEGDGGGGGNGGGIGRRMGGMAGLLDAGIISEALPAPSNRVQAWDFTSGQPPYIADSSRNVVVQRCRIHNDASIDISKDGRLLVALLPGTRLRNTNSWLGVYSLEWSRLGQCLHTAMLEQSAVSVALSPTARYLAVGLGSRRFTSAPHARNNIIALLYKLDPLENSSRTGLSPIKELMQHWEHGFTSLNCLRWAPQPGQGLVYANNTGQLIIMS